ncbi:PTS sugar transporter subunit IIA [Streptococcus massiliensis]|uniref:PTS system enzyme IIA component n=1 Tax=Streptococcus massiliensis TaxID=313439 RepID=A0A380L1V5_9STRE|nr:PTS sugar transporter subunit IIA [Streptococcus massiliensis]SUN77428.1 PTS system enzyme IIA component [Streptococcus massiliensis]
MVDLSSMFNKDLVFTDIKADDKFDFFRIASEKLVSLDYIENSFEHALIEREKEYPTGLNLGDFGIAIPHTDSIHVKKQFISVFKMTDAIKFTQMGTDDEEVEAKYIFVLGIKDPKSQVAYLASLISLLTNQQFLDALSQAHTKGGIKEILSRTFD